MNPLLVTPLAIWLVVSCLITPSLPREAGVGQAGDPIFVRPGCEDTCGTVKIPFPFGIGAGCFLDFWFEIDCRSNGSHRVPFLPKLKAEVEDIKSPMDSFQSLTVRIPPLSGCTADAQHQELSTSIDLRGGPYAFSTNNVFIMQGCAGSAILVNRTVGNTFAGCATVCHPNNTNDTFATENCRGVGCCQTNLLIDDFRDLVQSYDTVFSQQLSGEQRNCLVAALMLQGYVGKLSTSNSSTAPSVELSWGWVSHVQPDPNPYSICQRRGVTVSCSCEESFYGNPYVLNGCQNPKECKSCFGRCSGSPGNFSCRDSGNTFAAILGLSIAMGVLLLGIGCYGFNRLIRKERDKKLRAEFFKRNGGLLLQQQLSSSRELDLTKSTKIFTTKELEKATDRFNVNRILGQGGQGTVYKGMLSDGRIVAIKTSEILNEVQLEQFIHEVVILSQINHRNVVKLLGCCLEREVPLLVYEYVPNRTLSHHIHDHDDGLVFSWEMRLKIATDSAGAIAYLHSSSSVPIYHRDIKSSNILLDEKFRAKVSDFGSSKTIAVD